MEAILKKFQEQRHIYQVIARAHHLAASAYNRYNNYLGVPVVILTAIISTAIFATLENNPDLIYKIAAGLISLLATVLSALQTFLGFNQKAEAHKNAGIKYSAIKRRFDALHLQYSISTQLPEDAAMQELSVVLEEINTLAEEMPSIPDRFYNRAKKEYANKENG